MLFRIEGSSGFDPKPRTYNVAEYNTPEINKNDIDNYIAQKIREEINGTQNRELLSYSKSLATCILKYNRFADNELHIYDTKCNANYINYISPHNKFKFKSYFIQDRINNKPFFTGNGNIKLLHFIIDVSNNALVDEYLKKYTGKGKKFFASPEKDHEVIVMNPQCDMVIHEYMPSVYILYALQLTYNFLNNKHILFSLLNDLKNMNNAEFMFCPNERQALICLVLYLSNKWEQEYQISKNIYNYSDADTKIPTYYDPLWQFHDIITDKDFNLSLFLSTYNRNVVSDLFWKYCYIYLKNCCS